MEGILTQDEVYQLLAEINKGRDDSIKKEKEYDQLLKAFAADPEENNENNSSVLDNEVITKDGDGIKAYFEYEDGTFWAMRTEGYICLTVQGSKYRHELFRDWPEYIQESLTGKEEKGWMWKHSKKVSFTDSTAARKEGQRLAQGKSVGSITQDAEFWRIAVEINAYIIYFVPDRYKTKKLCALAVRKEGRTLKYVPAEIQTSELCTVAVDRSPCALKFVNESLKTLELCEKAIKKYGENLEFVPDKFKTKELCQTAVKESGWALGFVPDEMKTYELCTKAVKKNPDALKFVPDNLKTPELCHLAVSLRRRIIRLDIDHPFAFVPPELITREICLEAVKCDGSSLQFIPEEFKTNELCLLAVKSRGIALEYVPEKFKNYKLCLTAVKKHGCALKYAPDNLKTAELVNIAINQNVRAFECAPAEYKTRENCLAVLKQDNMDSIIFDHVPDTLKTKEFFEEAFALNVNSLQFMPENFITMEMCERAVKEGDMYGNILAYIPEKYRTEKIITVAIEKHIFALGDISDKLKTEQICLMAVKYHGSSALAYVPYKLRTPKICLEAAKMDGTGDAIWDVPSHIKTPEFYKKITCGSDKY